MIRTVDCTVLSYNRGEFLVHGGHHVSRECGVYLVRGTVHVGGGAVCGVNGLHVNLVTCQKYQHKNVSKTRTGLILLNPKSIFKTMMAKTKEKYITSMYFYAGCSNL